VAAGFGDRHAANIEEEGQTMKFTKDHEWVEVEGDVATVGVTGYAAEQLGDVVFVEVPEVGKTVKQGEGLAVVESVKAASDVYAPVSGEVVEANGQLSDAPETVNAVPEAGGWFAKIKLSNPSELDALMDRTAYEAFLSTL
jgi:glycine cleavage system H protein